MITATLNTNGQLVNDSLQEIQGALIINDPHWPTDDDEKISRIQTLTSGILNIARKSLKQQGHYCYLAEFKNGQQVLFMREQLPAVFTHESLARQVLERETEKRQAIYRQELTSQAVA